MKSMYSNDQCIVIRVIAVADKGQLQNAKVRLDMSVCLCVCVKENS